jgi:Ca2+-binding EF-hand superfamily protein
MACYSAVDPKKFGFIDFDQLKEFMRKFDSSIDTKKINSILRRMNRDEDFKIDFTEFTENLTPVL